VYAFLQRALKGAPADAPYRGDRRYHEPGLAYENAWTGDVAFLRGRETISRSGRLIYEAEYAGGLIDSRGD
jgi:hypothetical protein